MKRKPKKRPLTPENIYYLARKEIRVRLQAERCADRDHSSQRYIDDAKRLDNELKALGFVVEKETTWG